MNNLKLFLLFLLVSVLASRLDAQPLGPGNKPNLPHLEKHGDAFQLYVDGKPFLMRAGELGNSSASSLEYMKPIWPKLSKMHLNTVIMPVYWELIEPAEGKFDFNLLDGEIRSAREYGMKLVLLWFGSWKNSMSCYAPYWVKTDEARFPRARTKEGRAEEIITPFSEENRNADARAFAALMKHIRTIDGRAHTVVMVQVENEIGMIPDARDYSEQADRAFSGRVPPEFISILRNGKSSDPDSALIKLWKENGSKESGTWEEVLGKSLQTDEAFMAWYFAKYTDYVAAAGKEEYPLPMYVNAALIRPGYKPGQYPSAGPLPHLYEIWRTAAPSIDFLSPDIYFSDFAGWLGKYDRPGNPVFIPEVANGQSMANAFFAFARHNAMGYSPFSIESVGGQSEQRIAEAYDVLEQLTPLILSNQGTGNTAGVLLDSARQVERVPLGDYVFTFRHEYSWPYAARTGVDTPRVGGMIIMLKPDEFIVAGTGIVVTFSSRNGDGRVAGIAEIDEGSYVNGKWVARRRMNGDQDHQGRHLYLPGGTYGIQRLKLYTYR